MRIGEREIGLHCPPYVIAEAGICKKPVIAFDISSNPEIIINGKTGFLVEKNSFIFESVEKGKIKGRYTILGRNPDYIWEFQGNKCKQIFQKCQKIQQGKKQKETKTL